MESDVAMQNYKATIMAMVAEGKPHLRAREEQYVGNPNVCVEGIFIIRETLDGWWREHLHFSGNPHKQIEKLKNDESVAAGWILSPIFRDSIYE